MTKHRRDVTAQAKVSDNGIGFDPPLSLGDRDVLHMRSSYTVTPDGAIFVDEVHEAWITKDRRPRHVTDGQLG